MLYPYRCGDVIFYIAKPVKKSLEDLAEICLIKVVPVLSYFDNKLWHFGVELLPNFNGLIYLLKPVIYAEVDRYYKYLIFSNGSAILTNDISNLTGKDFAIRIMDEEPEGVLEAELIKKFLRGEIGK